MYIYRTYKNIRKMTRPQRSIKPTLKVLENNTHQTKKQKQTVILKKKIEKRKVILEKEQIQEIQKPFKTKDDIKVIRDSTNPIYKELYYDDKELLTQFIRLTIQEYTEDKLPPIFKGVVPLYIEKKPIDIKQTIYLSKLEKGEYQTASSKSDSGIASGIKTLLKYLIYKNIIMIISQSLLKIIDRFFIIYY